MSLTATWDNASQSLRLPCAMSLDNRRRSTVLLPPELFARVEDGARQRGWSFTRFAEWCLDQFLELRFLDQDNREFIIEVSRELGAPWTPLAVLNRLVSDLREQVRSGKLRPSFWAGQLRSLTRS